jgi:hypothetical protein
MSDVNMFMPLLELSLSLVVVVVLFVSELVLEIEVIVEFKVSMLDGIGIVRIGISGVSLPASLLFSLLKVC